MEAFVAADAAIAPVMTMAEVCDDSHVVAREALVEVDGVPMQNVVARLSATPGRVRWAGRAIGADDGELDDIWSSHAGPRRGRQERPAGR
jgi:crotonobetainyl-CoA:carnitine CoA-transferase CaiB-like acyl-CoA transferase